MAISKPAKMRYLQTIIRTYTRNNTETTVGYSAGSLLWVHATVTKKKTEYYCIFNRCWLLVTVRRSVTVTRGLIKPNIKSPNRRYCFGERTNTKRFKTATITQLGGLMNSNSNYLNIVTEEKLQTTDRGQWLLI